MFPTAEKVHIRKIRVSEAIRMRGTKEKTKERIDSRRGLAFKQSEWKAYRAS